MDQENTNHGWSSEDTEAGRYYTCDKCGTSIFFADGYGDPDKVDGVCNAEEAL